ncbi:MAG: phage tail tip lysozyme [Minicystis sp.]
MRMRTLINSATKRLALTALALPMLLTGCIADSDDGEDTVDKSSNEVVTENANDGIAFHYFVSKGLTDVQAAGIIGNLDQESGMDPTIWQYGGGPGRGIAQWSAGGRWDTDPNDNVAWYASKHGVDRWALQTQLDFIWYELTTFGFGFSDLKAAKDVTAATLAFMTKYEICGQCESSNRIAHAKAALAQFGGTKPPAQPAPLPLEGSQAFLYPNQQHFLHTDGAGNVRHHWWDAGTKSIAGDTWGTGAAGQPVTFVDGTSQHVFARATNGSLAHWFWDPVNGSRSDNWAPNAGLTGDPAAIMIGEYQDVWAVDGAGKLQHWWWGPKSNGVQHDTWGSGAVGRPSVFVTSSGEQHAFARGTGGTLEHWWWAPGATGISHDTWGTGLAGDPAALAIGDFQAVWAVDGAGNLQHWYWGPSTNGVKHDTWGSGAAGRPSVFVTSSGEQHAFARGKGGTLEHWWWTASAGISHDTWGSGITKDPTAEMINAQQHVWALDGAGHAQHWFWDPAANAIKHDDWGQ